MKISAMIVAIALILLPFVILIVYILTKLLTQGSEATFQSFTKPLSTSTIKSTRKILYLLSSIYGLLLFGAMLWALCAFSQNANISIKPIMFSVIFTLIIIAAEAVIIFYLSRYFNRIFPRPEVGSDKKAILEWENKRADLLMKYLGRILLIYIFIILFITAIFGISVFFLR